MIKILPGILMLAWTGTAFSQGVVQGKVIDALSRQPLEGATIEQAEKNKTTTDQYGRFSIRAANESAGITVTYVGYKKATASVEGKTDVLVEMQPDLVNMKDVVVLQSNSFSQFSTLAKVDLDLKPVRNTQELMRLVPGLFIAQHAGGGKAEQIFLRGFDNDHGTDIQISVDGLPVNMVSHAHGQGYADAHFIIPETIHNIDFGAGPYYTQRGNFNTSGYVSFSTFTNIRQSMVQVEAGSFNTFRTVAMVDLLKKNKDKQSAYVAGEFYYSDGPTISPQNFNRFNVFGKYNAALSERTQLTASLSGFKSKWDASGQIPQRAIDDGTLGRFGSLDPTEGGNTERYNANLVLSHRLANGGSWENQVYYVKNIFALYSNFTFFLNDPVNGDGILHTENRNLLGASSKYTRKGTLGRAALTSVYGGGVRYDATTTSFSKQVQRRFIKYYTLGDINETNAFGYMQQQASFGKWLFDAGVRFDYLHFAYRQKLNLPQMPSQGQSIISPKLNIQYTANARVQFYTKLGKGFHSNDTRVVVGNSGQEILPVAYGADVGVILKPSSKFFINVAAWYLYLQQEFVYVGDEAVIEPSGRSRRKGVDVIARYQVSNNLFANLNVNLTEPRLMDEPKGQNFIPLAPTFTSTGGLFYKPQQGWNGSLSYRGIKSRPAIEDGSITAKGYFVVDAAVNYLKPKYEVGLAVENLLNTEWNEAQFATNTRLRNEPAPVNELHFTPGNPFNIRVKLAVFF